MGKCAKITKNHEKSPKVVKWKGAFCHASMWWHTNWLILKTIINKLRWVSCAMRRSVFFFFISCPVPISFHVFHVHDTNTQSNIVWFQFEIKFVETRCFVNGTIKTFWKCAKKNVSILQCFATEVNIKTHTKPKLQRRNGQNKINTILYR